MYTVVECSVLTQVTASKPQLSTSCFRFVTTVEVVPTHCFPRVRSADLQHPPHGSGVTIWIVQPERIGYTVTCEWASSLVSILTGSLISGHVNIPVLQLMSRRAISVDNSQPRVMMIGDFTGLVKKFMLVAGR